MSKKVSLRKRFSKTSMVVGKRMNKQVGSIVYGQAQFFEPVKPKPYHQTIRKPTKRRR